VLVPGPPANSAVAQWDLGSELLGRSGCAQSPNGTPCAATMALSPEEPVNLSRTLTVPSPTVVTPTVWVRPRQGPNLADLVSAQGAARALGDADTIDVLGSAYAAADGDAGTAWTAPQSVVQHKTPPTLTLKLPTRSEVAGLRLTPSSSVLPAHPTLVAIDLGDGPQVRRLSSDGGAQTVSLRPHVTDTVRVSLMSWDDVIDRTALGFDQLKPPGLAEVSALDARGMPIAAADAARNRARAIDLPCGRGPIIGVAGQFVQTSIATNVGALLDGGPVAARPCRSDPITLPAGEQELLISPGAAFVVDGLQLAGPLASQLHTAATVPASTGDWSADHRELDVPASASSRVLVVPESINPGWTARSANGSVFAPVTVNGWQQGWVLPPGTAGTVTLSFTSNGLYRAGLIGGLALLPLLALLAFMPVRRPRPADEPARPWHPRRPTTSVAVVVAAAVISGIAGVVVGAVALGVRYLLRRREKLCEAVTVAVAAGGLILAGTVLSQHPWRSVDGYAGHSAGVQLLALASVAAVAASTVAMTRRADVDSPGERSVPLEKSAILRAVRNVRESQL
jgi:arabinofuranan 3-O-arabinosyltransferase